MNNQITTIDELISTIDKLGDLYVNNDLIKLKELEDLIANADVSSIKYMGYLFSASDSSDYSINTRDYLKNSFLEESNSEGTTSFYKNIDLSA